MRYFIQSLFTAAIILTAPATHAAQPCQNPAGDEGDQVYNITYHVMQYCNGSHWVAMGSHSASGDGLGDHIAGQALDMDGFRIQNLAPPTADNHAVTRAYVTSAIAAIPAPTAPNLSAVLATGNAAGNRKITGLASPSVGTDAATKTYADTKVSKGGDTMTGNLSVPAPSAEAHAATKEYVDTVVASASGGGASNIFHFRGRTSSYYPCLSGWNLAIQCTEDDCDQYSFDGNKFSITTSGSNRKAVVLGGSIGGTELVACTSSQTCYVTVCQK